MHTLIEFHEDTHEYYVNGIKKDSVTQILHGAGMLRWSGGTEIDRSYGRAAHKMCALDLEGKLDTTNLDPGLYNALTGWRKFRMDFKNLRPLTLENGQSLVERPMYHNTFGYCGTPDFPMTDGYKIYVIDLKNSAGNEPHWGVQIAGYVPMILQLININPIPAAMHSVKRLVLRLDHQEPTYSIIKCDDPGDWNLWLCALQIFNWKKKYGFSLER